MNSLSRNVKNRNTLNSRFLLLLILCILIHSLINYYWVSSDTTPLPYDWGGYFWSSVRLYQAVHTDIPTFFRALLSRNDALNRYHPHRVFMPLVSVPFYFLFGLSADTATMSCTVFLILILYGTYRLGSYMYDPSTGLLAAWIIPFFPVFFINYRAYAPEFAVTGLITLTVLWLIKSQAFDDTKYSVLSGIAIGFSMITKEMATPYLFPLILYFMYVFIVKVSRPPRSQKKLIRGVTNIILCLAIAGFIIYVFYWYHRNFIFSFGIKSAFTEKNRIRYSMPAAYDWTGLTWYLRKLLCNSVFAVYNFILCVIGVILSRITRSRYRNFLFFWFISNYACLCVTRTRSIEYAIPLLVPISIYIAYALNTLFRKACLKASFILIFLIFGFLHVFFSSFPLPLPKHGMQFLENTFHGIRYHPKHEYWPLEEIIAYIANNASRHNEPIFVYVATDAPSLGPMPFFYTAQLSRLNMIFSVYNTPIKEALRHDFIILKTGKKQGNFFSYADSQEILRKIEQLSAYEKLPDTFLLPDQSQVIIFKNTKPYI